MKSDSIQLTLPTSMINSNDACIVKIKTQCNVDMYMTTILTTLAIATYTSTLDH